MSIQTPPLHLCGWVDDPARVPMAATFAPRLARAAPALMATDTTADVFLYRAWKDALGAYPSYVAQQIGDCFPAGTMVTMADGAERPIESVRPGAVVLSHRNQPRHVSRVVRKPYSGEMIGITAGGFAREVVATTDHRFLTYPGLTSAKKSRGVATFATWAPVGLLEEGNRVLIPWGVPDEPTAYPIIDVLPFVRDAVVEGDRVRVKGSSRFINRFVAVDPTFCWLLGLYLAQGGISDGPTGNPCRIDLNLGGRDYFEATNAIEAFRSVFGVEAEASRLPSKPNVLYVRCSCAAAADVFRALMPGNLYSKSVPPVVFAVPRLARLACLRGWLDGDGCIRRDSSFKVNGIGSSHALMHGMYRLAVSCRLRPKLHQRRQYAHQRVAAKSMDFYGDSALAVYPEYDVEVRSEMRLTAGRIDVVEDGLALPVKTIRRFDVAETEVYCLEVEDDHSFIANGYAVHNCTSFGSGHALDLLQAVEIVIGKEPIEWKETCTEAIYGMGREIGGMLGGGDGCYGVAVAKALVEHGAVPREAVGPYDGKRAKSWGRTGVPAEIKAKMADFKVGASAMINSLDELDAALANGYPSAGGFSQGFTMTRDADGVCRQSGSWGHETMISGKRTRNGKRQYCMCQSWGNNVPDGPTTDDQPDFSFWIAEEAMASIIGQRDWLAFSGFAGFKRRPLPSSWTAEGFA